MRQPVPFGKYLLLDRISVGGMAEVFKAKSYGVEGFEKIIAIKRILPTMGEDRDFIKMFIDEAKIAGQLAHANICQIFELGRIDGSHFIAMEYIWGKDLLQIQNRLRKTKKPIPVPMACFVIAKVLEGLDYAHRKRDPLGRPLEIVHRDCSPQNVLVSYEGEVKVIDFGIAKATSRNSRTMAGVLKGKFGYMSPEQVRGLPLDRRSDIFAIGTMLYECLTSERLFHGETDFSTLEKVRNVDIQPPRALNPQIPEVVERVILKALAKDVEDRYQWCSEMLADLQAFLMSQDVVFTAKSLSSWLKEVFQTEIDRERALLEQYKRVGRDGLIAGVPSAEAKLDVVEHLGEAGAPEGDATTLGGPNFDDIEKDTGASPDMHASPAAAGARHSVQRKATPPPQVAAQYQEDEEGEGDFHDEAPTEIFGEIEGQQPPPPAAAAPRPSRSHPATRPPHPPPGRPSSQRPAESLAASRAPTAGPMGDAQMAHSNPYQQPYVPQSLGTPPGSQPAQVPNGSQPLVPHVPQIGQDGQVQRTVLGVQAPQGLGNYGGGYRPSQQHAAQHPMPDHMQQQPYGYGQPQQQPYGYSQQGYPQQYGMQGYPGSGPVAMVAAPVDQMQLERKRSTLVRDIAIGVGIAALVLVGFLVVKIFVLDAGTKPNAAPTAKFATVKFAMPAGMTAEMIVDGSRVATVSSESTGVPLGAGTKHIKLVGSNGLSCDDPQVKLEAGKTTTLECSFGVGSGSAVAAPPAGSTVVAQGSGTDAKTDPKADAKSDSKADAKSDSKADPKADAKADPKADAKADPKADAKADTKTDIKKTVKTERPKVEKTDPKKAGSAAEVGDGGDPTKGYVQLFSTPPAKILVDGAETGKTTPVTGHSLPLAPGKHKITFVIGDDKFTYPVVIKAGSTETMSKDLQ